LIGILHTSIKNSFTDDIAVADTHAMLANEIRWKWRFLIIAAAVITFLPSVNNGFMQDDFILLNRIEILKTNPYNLIEVAPELFRVTSYIVLAVLKALFTYDYRAYYVVNILLHAINSVLLAEIANEVFHNDRVAIVTGVLFAVFQAPQEAVMWIGAMNEMLLGLFVILTVLFWLRGRYLQAILSYTLALWSKESALVVLLIVPLIELYRGRRGFWRQYLWLLLPTAAFTVAFLLTFSKNFMVNNEIHAFRWHAVITLARSLNRLLWPWAYLLIVLVRVTKLGWPLSRSMLVTAALLIVAVLPYIFVTYTYLIPSRQTYMASAILVTALSAAVLQLSSRRLQTAVLASFIAFNVVYVWTRKDSQMRRRAAPTTALIEELKTRSPGPVRIIGFEYPASEMAKGAAVTIPGWHWEDVELIPPGDRCANCVILEWDRDTLRYIRRDN
jgi:hypothetical protein